MKDFNVKQDGVEIKKETINNGNTEKLSIEIPNMITVKEGRSKMSGGLSVRTRESGRSITLTLEVKINTSGKLFTSPVKLSDLIEGLGITEEDMGDFAKEIGKCAVVGTFEGKEAILAWVTPFLEKVKGALNEG